MRTGTLGAVGFATVGTAKEELSKSQVYVGKGSAETIIPKVVGKMGGMGRFVSKGSSVVIKPNMSFANPPEWATTTSPEAVRVVAQLCLNAGAREVVIVDNTLRNPESCKRETGIAKAVEDLKGVIILIPKDASLFKEQTSDKAKALVRTDIVRAVVQADTLITLPAAKSHGAAGVSLGLKNLMGLVRKRGVYHREMDLHLAIAEQLYYMKPALSIIDATRALLDNGPSGPGTVKELKTFVAGTDPVATDSYAVTLTPWYGKKFEGNQVAHLKNAAELGFGKVESSEISEIMV